MSRKHLIVRIVGYAAAATALGFGIASNYSTANASSTVSRPAGFATCAGCHSTIANHHGVGPSLTGISRRTSGSAQGFTYSPALKNSNIRWDANTLDRWLTSPKAMVPGNKMPFAGLSDPQRRREIVNYLMTL